MNRIGVLLLALFLCGIHLASADISPEECDRFVSVAYTPCIRKAMRMRKGINRWRSDCFLLRSILTRWNTCNDILSGLGCHENRTLAASIFLEEYNKNCLEKYTDFDLYE
ncbi:Uncharacterised protein at_DN2331 [Pycnogonum litorale]